MLDEQCLCGPYGAGTRRPQRELHALVGHLLLELRDFRVQRIGGLGGLRRLRDFALELGDLGVLGLERLAPLVRA